MMFRSLTPEPGWTLLLALGVVLAIAPGAGAAVVWTVAVSTDGSSMHGLVPGDRVILDITARSDGEALFALAGSANDYDPSLFEFESATSLVAPSIFNIACLPAGCFGGLENTVGISQPFEQSEIEDVGVEVEFFTGVSGGGVTGTGEIDPGVVTGQTGDAQFRLVFRALREGAAVIRIGSFADYFDAAVVASGVPGEVTNTSVSLVVMPEPGTALLLGLGLAGLATSRSTRTAAPIRRTSPLD